MTTYRVPDEIDALHMGTVASIERALFRAASEPTRELGPLADAAPAPVIEYAMQALLERVRVSLQLIETHRVCHPVVAERAMRTLQEMNQELPGLLTWASEVLH